MPYDEITGFPMSKKTWMEISEKSYFKILEKAQSDYPEEIEQILKPKKTTTIIEPLSKRDLLGIISLFNLSNNFPDPSSAKITTLRNKLKKIAVSESNEELNKYLVAENLMDRTLTSKRVETITTQIKHNKTRKLMNFVLSKYLDLDLEIKPEEPEEELEEEELEEAIEVPEEIQE